MKTPGKRNRPKMHVPPSRRRYEKAHPTVSIRISRAMRTKLAELKDQHGLSMGGALRIGLQIAGPDLDAAFDKGMVEGYEIAREEFEVTFVCSRCSRRHLSVTDNRAKEAAAKLLYEAGLHSPNCRA